MSTFGVSQGLSKFVWSALGLKVYKYKTFLMYVSMFNVFDRK